MYVKVQVEKSERDQLKTKIHLLCFFFSLKKKKKKKKKNNDNK